MNHHTAVQPGHYHSSTGQLQVIDVVKAWDLDFCLGNVVKYVLRAGKKDRETYLEDLQKAQWYLSYTIQECQQHLMDDEAEQVPLYSEDLLPLRQQVKK